MTGNRAELYGAAIVIVVAAFFLYFSFDIERPMTGDPLGPRWLPTVLSSILLLLGVAQIVNVMRQGADEELEGADGKSEPHRGNGVVVVASGLTMAYAAVLLSVGYVAATTAFAITIYYLYGRRTLPMAVLSGAAVAACFYVLFTFGLQSNLPIGDIWGSL